MDGSCSRMFEVFLAADSFQLADSDFRLAFFGPIDLGARTEVLIDIFLIDTLKGCHLFSLCRKKTKNDSICIRSC